MGDKTKIEWCDATWNPILGCTKVGAGCDNCYAMRSVHRMAGNPKLAAAAGGTTKIINGRPGWTGVVRCLPERLEIPLHWRAPRRIFVASQSDPFHEAVPDEFLDRMFAVMALTPQHTYQLLTKRPERMREYLTAEMVGARIDAATHEFGGMGGVWFSSMPNVWGLVSVEDQATADARIPVLLETPLAVRGVSAEPLIGPVSVQQWIPPVGVDDRSQGPWPYLDWAIVGGESGPGARPFDLAWARWLIAQCRAAGTAVFVKQLGAKPHSIPDRISYKGDSAPKPNGFYRFLNHGKGGDPAEWPEDLRVREFPA